MNSRLFDQVSKYTNHSNAVSVRVCSVMNGSYSARAMIQVSACARRISDL